MCFIRIGLKKLKNINLTATLKSNLISLSDLMFKLKLKLIFMLIFFKFKFSFEFNFKFSFKLRFKFSFKLRFKFIFKLRIKFNIKFKLTFKFKQATYSFYYSTLLDSVCIDSFENVSIALFSCLSCRVLCLFFLKASLYTFEFMFALINFSGWFY